MKARHLLIAAAISALLRPGAASACATCGVDPNSYVADASNSVLWVLLGLVALMFAATGLTAFYLWRRANAPIPPHIQFVENLTAEPEEA
jgi:hypothetical protein